MQLKTLLSIMFLCLSFWGYSKPLRFASMEYPPFYGSQLGNNGPFIDIVRQAYAISNVEIEILFLPWSRAIEWSKKGKVDGLIAPWRTKEREDYLLFSSPIYPNQMVFYKTLAQPVEFSSYQDLAKKDLVLGSVRGYFLLDKLASSGVDIHYVNNDIQNFKLLSKGRVQLILVDKHYAEYVLQSPVLHEALNKVELIDSIVEERMQYIAISRNTRRSAYKLSLLEHGLRELKKTGKYNQILRAHNLTEN